MQTKLFWYKEGEPIYLLTDASDYGIGGYLYQLIDERERPVALAYSPDRNSVGQPFRRKATQSFIASPSFNIFSETASSTYYLTKGR